MNSRALSRGVVVEARMTMRGGSRVLSSRFCFFNMFVNCLLSLSVYCAGRGGHRWK